MLAVVVAGMSRFDSRFVDRLAGGKEMLVRLAYGDRLFCVVM